MNIPESIQEWDTLTESEKIKIVENAIEGKKVPGELGVLKCDKWFLIYVVDENSKLTIMDYGTQEQILERVDKKMDHDLKAGMN